MTFRPPKAPRKNEYLKNGNFCRNVLLRLIAQKPHLQMQTLPLDRPFCLAQIVGAVSGRSGSRNRRAISLMRVWFGKGIGRSCTSADEFFTAVGGMTSLWPENDRADCGVGVDGCGQDVEVLLHSRRHEVMRGVAEPDQKHAIVLLDSQSVQLEVACKRCQHRSPSLTRT